MNDRRIAPLTPSTGLRWAIKVVTFLVAAEGFRAGVFTGVVVALIFGGAR